MDGDLDLGPSPKLATLQRSAAPGSHMIGAILVHDGASSIGQEMAPAAAGSRNGQGIAGTRERLSRAFQPVSRWGRRRRTATRAKGLGRECASYHWHSPLPVESYRGERRAEMDSCRWQMQMQMAAVNRGGKTSGIGRNVNFGL